MEEKKNSTAVIFASILCLLIGFAAGYFISTNLLNNNSSNNQSNTSTDDNLSEKTISEEEVKQIYSTGIKKYLKDPVRELSFDSQTFTKEEEKLEWILGTGETQSLESIGEYCGTELEKQLIEEKVIVEKNTGETDCETVTFYKADSVVKAIKKVFGNDVSFDLNKLNSNEVNTFPYIKAHNLVFVLRAGMTADVTDNYMGYSIDSNVLTIKFSIVDAEKVTTYYEAKYIIDGENTYIRSIKKV